MSDWSGPTPNAQQYPGRPTDGIAQLVGVVRDQGTKLREVTANLLRSMGVRARPGQMSSLDYDGTDQTHLGTAGWALASDNGGPSYLALNGIDVYADLEAKASALAAQQATLTSQQATLTSQQADLASQLASINTLISQQVTSSAATPGTASGFSVGTTQATKASTTVTVPSGYTSALAVVIGSLTMSDTSANRFDTRAGISGAYGTALPNLANTVGCSAASHSRTLTGLTAGSTITFEIQALAAVASTNAANTAVVTGFAIFFR